MKIETLKINELDYAVSFFGPEVQGIVAELQVLVDEKVQIEEDFNAILVRARREAAKIDALSAIVQEQLREAAQKDLDSQTSPSLPKPDEAPVEADA